MSGTPAAEPLAACKAGVTLDAAALDAPLDDEAQHAGGALPPSRGEEVEDDDVTPRFDPIQ